MPNCWRRSPRAYTSSEFSRLICTKPPTACIVVHLYPGSAGTKTGGTAETHSPEASGRYVYPSMCCACPRDSAVGTRPHHAAPQTSPQRRSRCQIGVDAHGAGLLFHGTECLRWPDITHFHGAQELLTAPREPVGVGWTCSVLPLALQMRHHRRWIAIASGSPAWHSLLDHGQVIRAQRELQRPERFL